MAAQQLSSPMLAVKGARSYNPLLATSRRPASERSALMSCNQRSLSFRALSFRAFHLALPRAIVALHSPADAMPIAQRFDEIWDLSEPAVSATKLGL